VLRVSVCMCVCVQGGRKGQTPCGLVKLCPAHVCTTGAITIGHAHALHGMACLMHAPPVRVLLLSSRVVREVPQLDQEGGRGPFRVLLLRSTTCAGCDTRDKGATPQRHALLNVNAVHINVAWSCCQMRRITWSHMEVSVSQ
jgi:hypothetical protein